MVHPQTLLFFEASEFCDILKSEELDYDSSCRRLKLLVKLNIIITPI